MLLMNMKDQKKGGGSNEQCQQGNKLNKKN